MIPQSKLEDTKRYNRHSKAKPKSSEKYNMVNLAAFSLGGFSEHRARKEVSLEALEVRSDPSTESNKERKATFRCSE